jgi:hypothetical protein
VARTRQLLEQPARKPKAIKAANQCALISARCDREKAAPLRGEASGVPNATRLQHPSAASIGYPGPKYRRGASRARPQGHANQRFFALPPGFSFTPSILMDDLPSHRQGVYSTTFPLGTFPPMTWPRLGGVLFSTRVSAQSSRRYRVRQADHRDRTLIDGLRAPARLPMSSNLRYNSMVPPWVPPSGPKPATRPVTSMRW